MKPSFFSSSPTLAMASLVLLGALSLPDISLAKPKDKEPPGHAKKSEASRSSYSRSSGSDRDRDGDRDRDSGRDRDGQRDYSRSRGPDWTHYHSRPRTGFTLSFGNGYQGRGYYYGPPGVPYYYERADVRYYRTRELAPRQYWDSSYRSGSIGASVQRALARRGYYRGSIDGQLGPYSQRSIARYQADHGLRPTGLVSGSLLRSLGLQ